MQCARCPFDEAYLLQKREERLAEEETPVSKPVIVPLAGGMLTEEEKAELEAMNQEELLPPLS